MTDEQIDDWMFKNAEWTEQLGSAVPADKVRALLAESAPTPKPASPETLSDAELLAHFQKSPANPSDKQEPVSLHDQIAQANDEFHRPLPTSVNPSDKQEAADPFADWELIRVKHLAELVDALDRADRKGYMPDAIADSWEAFQYVPAAPLAQSAEQDRIDAEPKARYCPSCGSIGPVESKYRDCCPDGSDARMVPEKFAEKCRDTFHLAIDSIRDREND